MSSDWWLNNIGSASRFTAPVGSTPSYGVAYDVGTAPWSSPQQFNNFAADTVRRTRGAQIAQAEQQTKQSDEGWFQHLTGAFGKGIQILAGVGKPGELSHDIFDPNHPLEKKVQARGAQRLSAFEATPGVHQIFQGLNTAFQAASTPFILDTMAGQQKDLGLWLDKSSWGAAWRAANDETLGQAIVNDVLTATTGASQADLDRMRRTNSLYGMTTFATDLYVGAKLDPTVLGAKGVGEVRNIKQGILPLETSRLKPAALRAARGQDVRSFNPLTKYASYRGKQVRANFGELRDYAQNNSLADMTALPMFRRLAVNGPQAALAFKIAAGDDKLWDLTQRAVLADPAAWAEIGQLKHSVPSELRDYAPADTRTYLDAIDATKTNMQVLQDQVNDLEKVVAAREAQTPLRDENGQLNPGFFNYHTWELSRDLADKQADIEEMARRLEGHDDYGTWLAQLPHTYGDNEWYSGPVADISQVKATKPPLDFLSQHTYQKSAYGATHTVTQISKAGWMKKANPIDLNRVDSGVMSIRSQFEQFDHLMGYRDPAGLEDAITRFVKAPNSYERFKVAKSIEDTHLVNALAQKFGLEPETIDAFLNNTRLRKNEMMNALLSGQGAVYSTGTTAETAKIISRSKGMAEIEVMDNGRRITMRVPEEALAPQTLPVDPTQAPNMYLPMDTRQVYLAVKRNNELFEALDQDVRQFGAKHTAKVMEGINELGTTWNQLWKPLQLFRLAWPQRVIMDEGLRALAIVGVNTWARNFGGAMVNASLNAVSRTATSIPDYLSRKNTLKMGPGPVTDDLTGRISDTASHEAAIQDAPVVAERFAPQLVKARQDKLSALVDQANAVQRIQDRNAALMRNPNKGISLSDEYLASGSGAVPHDWAAINDVIQTGQIDNTPFTLEDLAKAKDPLANDARDIASRLHAKTDLERALEDPDITWVLGTDARTANDYQMSTQRRLVEQYGIGGTRRAHLEHAIQEGRKAYDKELAHRKTGAGHGPLFPHTFANFRTKTAQRDLLMARDLGAEWAPGNGQAVQLAWPAPTRLKDQLPQAFHADFATQVFRDNALGSTEPYIKTFDPTTGRPVGRGYAVPIYEAEVNHVKDLHTFIAQHQDLLASQGYRLTIKGKGGQFGTLDSGPQHTVQLVRVFKSNEIKRATDFADQAGADHFLSLHEGHKQYVRQWTDRSPIMEELDRRFINTPEVEFSPGEAPIAGSPAVFHGTSEGLPENLNPRERVPAARGNYAGQGFYTTVDKGLAESYNRAGLYTIRGSKSGRRYKTFDLESEMTEADKEGLIQYIRDYYDEVFPEATQPNPYGANELDYSLNEISRSVKWLHAMSELEGARVTYEHGVLTPQQLVTKYLAEVKGAGALMYDGGRLTGGKLHQVYVWLHPEDLEVKPAYAKTGRYYSVAEWFEHPDSVERLYPDPSGLMESRIEDIGKAQNQVPENRIKRVGPKPRAAERNAIQEAQDRAAKEAQAAEASAQEAADTEANLAIDNHVDDQHQAFIRRLLKRRQFGRGYSSWKTADGGKVVAQNALEGPGEVYVPLVSSNPVYTRLTDTYKRTLSKHREKAVGYKSTPPPDVSPEALRTTAGREAAQDYYTSWADLVNDQVRNSPIWYRMLEGQSDEQIVHWLTSTDEGARVRKEFPHLGNQPEKWVEEHRQRLNSYVPDQDLQKALAGRQVIPSELRRIPAERMPTIYEPDLQLVSGKGELANMFRGYVDKVYHALGTVPSDVLVRQPFFKSMYDLKMRNLVRAADADQLTNATLRGYEKLAREFALRQVKRNVFDLADETNFTQAMRFLAPFWNAQQEAMTKWLNIAVEKPETVAKFYVGINAAYNNFQVINEDGKPTTGPNNLFHYNANDRVILQIPKALTKVAPFDKMLKEFGSVGIAFGAANTALQGDNPMIPSLGPIVTIPADKLANAMWDTHGTQFDNNFFYRWLFPVGRPAPGLQGTLDQIFPGWGRRLEALQQGQDSRSYANTYWSVYRELDLDHRKRGLPPPTPEEVDSATKWHFGLRVLAAFALPAAMEFRPKHQLFLDEYHKMQELYGPDAFEQFVKKYGADAARYAASSSDSPVGLPPTAKGMEEWSQNKQLIQKYPNWGGAIVSPDAWADGFSSDAYGAQFDIKVGPGTRKTLRELTDPQDRANQTDVRLGWLQYRQFESSINAELYQRGLTSITQSGAEDLQALKRQFVGNLEKQLPAWAEDYNTFDNTIYQRVGELSQFAFLPQFNNRPDMQGVRQYLKIRQAAAQSLDQYAATGGSRSLQAQENTGLRNWFYTQVGSLIQQNPAFGEFYTRYLESDRLERGSGP